MFLKPNILKKYKTFLVGGRGLVRQQEISLVLAKTLPIHYYTVMDSAFSNYTR